MYMRLSDLQQKMVINIQDGKHLGVIVDADIKESGEINYFVIATRHFFKRLFKNEAETNVTIKQIVKIGTDVILVDL